MDFRTKLVEAYMRRIFNLPGTESQSSRLKLSSYTDCVTGADLE
jgi:hypothetical protein